MSLEEYQSSVREKNRTAILDAALASFLENGYERTSLQTIADRAQVSSATLYKHFPSKSDLFGAVAERMWARLDASFEGDEDLPSSASTRHDNASPVPNLEPSLRSVGQAYASLLSEPDVIAFFRLIVAETPRAPELGRTLYRKGKRPFLNRLESLLRSYATDVQDVELAARQFLGMINDIVFWPRQLVTDLDFDREEIDRVVDEAVETFLARYG